MIELRWHGETLQSRKWNGGPWTDWQDVARVEKGPLTPLGEALSSPPPEKQTIDKQLRAWFEAASPYATPGALKEALNRPAPEVSAIEQQMDPGGLIEDQRDAAYFRRSAQMAAEIMAEKGSYDCAIDPRVAAEY